MITQIIAAVVTLVIIAAAVSIWRMYQVYRAASFFADLANGKRSLVAREPSVIVFALKLMVFVALFPWSLIWCAARLMDTNRR